MNYPDTSFLVPRYVPEPQSSLVMDYLEKKGERLIYTPFHRLEVRTAIRVRVYRTTLSADQHRRALQLNEEDVASRVLQLTPLSWNDTLREAERFGEKYLAKPAPAPAIFFT